MPYYTQKKIEKAYKKRQKVKPSEAEQKIIDFLNTERVQFKREVPVLGLKSSTGYALFFDFYLPKYNLFIEFQGKHHYEKYSINYERIKNNDNRKVLFCKRKGFNLLVIPYWLEPSLEICKKIDKITN